MERCFVDGLVMRTGREDVIGSLEGVHDDGQDRHGDPEQERHEYEVAADGSQFDREAGVNGVPHTGAPGRRTPRCRW